MIHSTEVLSANPPLSVASSVAEMFKGEEIQNIVLEYDKGYNQKTREVNTLADSIINANKK